MIYAIGHDIAENHRIGQLLEQYQDKFVSKILSLHEKTIYATKTNKVNYLAKRFAAKEAFAKACKTGLVAPILMPNISIVNDELGHPSFIFDESIQNWLIERKIKTCHLSLSDEVSLSSAIVILEM